MKALLALPAVLVALFCWLPATGPALADTGALDPSSAPPYVAHTEWTQWAGLTSLRVFPTPSGRIAARVPGTSNAANEAWTEVLTLSPDADTAGMHVQFSCHWQLAELIQPGKASWNLEPWRPVVDDAEMFASGCNPGSPEGPF